MISFDSARDFIPQQRERKFLLEADTARELWALACAHLPPAHPHVDYAQQLLRTTYFDTPQFDYYHSRFSSVRRRLRVREYSSVEGGHLPMGQGTCYLELKHSTGTLRAKRRVELAHGELEAHLATFTDQPVAACVASRYRRSALTSNESELRITLDEELEFCAPVPLGRSFTERRDLQVFGNGPPYILEVKIAHEEPEWLSRALSSLTEAREFSKFIVGMESAFGYQLNSGEQSREASA